jgi:5-methylcytosine-specific restriction endonuclease McrA
MGKPFNLGSQIRGQLRLLFRRSPHHKAALQKARIEKQKFNKDGSLAKRPAVFYECEICKGHFRVTHVEVDHVTPIGPAPGSKNAPEGLTWDMFINRVFCSYLNLRVLCKPCHLDKTKRERRNG